MARIMIYIVGTLIICVFYKIGKSWEHKKWVEQETRNSIQLEKERGDDIKLRINLTINRNDLTKAGYSKDYKGLVFLYSVSDGTVHFSIKDSPALHLLSAEYSAEYSQETSGTISGRSGSAIAGGMLFGNIGAAAGAARKRSINTTTKNIEHDTWGLLTFVEANGGKPFVIRCIMAKPNYNSLNSEFIWHEEITPTKTESINYDELKKLGELYESGVLTDEEFTSKKTEILSK
jgi:hypothetical protein